jgi:phospholipase D1/2
LRRRRSEDSNYEDDEEYDEEYIDKNYNEDPDPKLPVISNEGYYWIGKDYANTYTADFKDIADFSSDQFDREETPRMPWRDEALVIFGDSARDLARHFIQRWNQCKREKVRQIQSYPFLLPKSYADPYNYKYQDWFKDSLFRCNVQITRSLDSWSGGINQTETSIQNAYCEMIKNSEHFIYIENQFFVTTTDPDKDTYVKNKIGFELVQRIKKAHKQNKKFRVYVVLPLLPGFDSFNAIQAVQYFNLRSIRLGEYSIYNELKKEGISDPTEYITFHGMRNWSVLMGKLVQEIIYVHSKLMIVDDKYVICGSANINDRSLLGKRDSEIACVIKDEEFIDSKLNGKQVKVGKYAFTLRSKIFKLHIGIYEQNPSRIDIRDCASDNFFKLVKDISKHNTDIYDNVFKW